MKQPFKESIELIKKALDEELKEKMYQLWLVRYPNYDKNNFETFEQFYDKYRPQKIQYDTRSKEEIMQDILKIDRKEE